MRLKKIFLTIAFIFIALRFFIALSTPPIDDDECHLYQNAATFFSTNKIVFFNYLYEPAVIDVLSSGLFFKITGTANFFSGRVLEIIFGIGTFWVTWKLSFLLFKDKTAAYLASLFLICSFPHLIFSTLYLKYMKASFYFLLSIYCFLFSTEQKKSAWAVFSGILFTLSIFTKMFIIVHLLGILVLLFFSNHKKVAFFFLTGTFLSISLLISISISVNNSVNTLGSYFSLLGDWINGFYTEISTFSQPVYSGYIGWSCFNPLILLSGLVGGLTLLNTSFKIRFCYGMILISLVYILFNPCFHYPRLILPVFPLICLFAGKSILWGLKKYSRGFLYLTLPLLLILYSLSYYPNISELIKKYDRSLAALKSEDFLESYIKHTKTINTKVLLVQEGGQEYRKIVTKAISPMQAKTINMQDYSFIIASNSTDTPTTPFFLIYKNTHFSVFGRNEEPISNPTSSADKEYYPPLPYLFS